MAIILGVVPLVIGALAAPSRGQSAKATIAGGADATSHSYTWVVTNGHAVPITQVEFPHYRAALFFAPDGWATASTGLVNVGVRDAAGVCTATAKSAADGIAPGRSATFSLQIAAAGAKRGRGEVIVRFADGTSTAVAGVELPGRESAGDRYVPLTGLGAVLIVLLATRAKRRRRRRAEGSSAGGES